MSLRALDDLVARIERVLILVAVTGMTVLVGADVVQRTFSRPVGKTEQLVAAIGEKIAGPLSETTRALLEGRAGNAIFLVIALAFFVLGAHASRQVKAQRSSAPPPKFVGSLALGGGVLLAITAAVKLLLLAFPSSVPGAQKFALGLMLWAGMLGASLATRDKRHIVIDAVIKKLDDDAKRPFALLSGLATAMFCLFIFVLGALQLAGEVRDWAAHDGVGVFESLPIPTWTVTLAIPTTFLIMGLRFLAYGVRDFRFGVAKGGDGGHGVDLEELQTHTVDVEEKP